MLRPHQQPLQTGEKKRLKGRVIILWSALPAITGVAPPTVSAIENQDFQEALVLQ